MPLQAGQQLKNKYTILRELTPGGFSRVYLARDEALGHEVAIKELVFADERAAKRFFGEFQAMILLRHPKIVEVYEIIEDQGGHLMVMEYMAGGSLQMLLEQQGRLNIDRAIQIASGVSEALAFAHAHRVVHCDIKPANILFAADGTAKLTDFGIAHISELLKAFAWTATPRSFIAGTVFYMSPEQVEGVRDDARIDVYALGAVLYQMLAGRYYLDFDLRAIPVATANNVNRIKTRNPQPPSTHNPSISPRLDRIVLTALSKERQRRYATIVQLSDALQREQSLAALFAELKALADAQQWALAIARGNQLLAAAPDYPGARELHVFVQRECARQQRARQEATAALTARREEQAAIPAATAVAGPALQPSALARKAQALTTSAIVGLGILVMLLVFVANKVAIIPGLSSGDTPAAAQDYETYTVQPGDTISQIAARYRLTVEQLIALNADRYPALVRDPLVLQLGWRLRVPSRATARETQTAEAAPQVDLTKRHGEL